MIRQRERKIAIGGGALPSLDELMSRSLSAVRPWVFASSSLSEFQDVVGGMTAPLGKTLPKVAL
jgi:hypothetical protein